MTAVRFVAAVVYSTALGALVAGLFWQTFHRALPEVVTLAVGGILAIRVTTLFASATSVSALHWTAIWIGGACGVAALVATWPGGGVSSPPVLLAPLTVAAVAVSAAANGLPLRRSAHLYHRAGFARFVHHLQGVLLFAFALPASIAWRWPRPLVVAVILSAFALWRSWGACPVTLAENHARAHEGAPPMPPQDGFVPDVLATVGITVSGETVGTVLYAVGLVLCTWFGLDWLMGLQSG
jgi:hypothetical protein